jgi:hypothetical protein
MRTDWTGADWMNPDAQLFWENYQPENYPAAVEDELLGGGRSISRGFGGCATCDGGGCRDCT